MTPHSEMLFGTVANVMSNFQSRITMLPGNKALTLIVECCKSWKQLLLNWSALFHLCVAMLKAIYEIEASDRPYKDFEA